MTARFAGVDIGAVSSKAAIVDASGGLVGSAIVPSGTSPAVAAEKAMLIALTDAAVSPEQIEATISTGYGRESVAAKTRAVTEITCHARGASVLYPQTRLVIDIGGQDSKAISLGNNGAVKSFEMNDKCAAGTGRFLEVMARTLEVGLDEMGAIALKADKPATISSTCTVFAESEVVSLLAQGESVACILAGLCNSVAERVRALASRVGIQPEATMTGGVAKNVGVVKSLENMLGMPLNIPDEPQIVGALGAALIARDDGMNRHEG